jgi:hypothetical protein
MAPRTRRHRLVLTLACLALGLVGGFGCKRLSTGALETFAQQHSCPEERVQVREREDLDPEAVKWGAPTPLTPPDEVRRDPARLARFQRDQAEQQARRRASYAGYAVFEVSGCDHKELLVCHHPGGSRGGTDAVSCSEGKQPSSPPPPRPKAGGRRP